MTSIFALALALATQLAFAQRSLTLYDCARSQPGLDTLVYEHKDLQREKGIPEMSLVEHEQLLRQSGSCQAFVTELQRRMRELQRLPSRDQSRRGPAPRDDQYPDPGWYEDALEYEDEYDYGSDPESDDDYYDHHPDSDEGRREPAPRREERADPAPRRQPAPRRESAPRPERRQSDRADTSGVPRAPGGILIVTDERYPRAAQIVEQSFANVPPFSCLNISVAIHQVDPSDFGCTGESPRRNVRGRERIVLCGSSANAKAATYKRQSGARHVIIVTDNPRIGGNGGTPAVVTNSIILQGGPLAGIHELMHTFGFRDTYVEGNWQSEGDIMACTGPSCYVLPGDYNKVARAFGKSVPSSCR